MKNTTIIWTAIIIAASALALSTGCGPGFNTNITVSPEMNTSAETGPEINPITGEPYQDIAEKRGYQTNITEFSELLARASSIQSYDYNLTDTELGITNQRFYVLGRFIKTQLPEAHQYSTGELYDEIFLERTTKTAFSHCSKYLCPKPGLDKELEKAEYTDYYVNDPMEYLYKATKPKFVKEEMVGNQATKVFDILFEGKDARIWLQEYYGFPIKIMVKNDDETKRTIRFEDMMVDATARGEIDLPFNFTVKGEGNKTWIFWEHYLGEWPNKGSDIIIPTGEPALSI
ncbi:hypothetical protein JW898_04225 [Candidatus Woesearchaeota archaeon]|nr:hypothetical protein [Candidatus Woesearchaeota archaeon]